jgi:hypothetical protein
LIVGVLYQEIERSDKTSVKLGTRGTQFFDATEINSTCRSFNMGGKRAAGAFVSGKRWKSPIKQDQNNWRDFLTPRFGLYSKERSALGLCVGGSQY